MGNMKVQPKFSIGDVVKQKDGSEHLITGISEYNGETLYSIDEDNCMTAWFFPAKDQDNYEKVGHHSIVKGDKVYL